MCFSPQKYNLGVSKLQAQSAAVGRRSHDAGSIVPMQQLVT